MRLATSPSNLDEFIQIKEQINYLRRPDKQTDWKIVEKLSAHLLAENGIDLQTLVYSTVARYQLSSSFTQITKDIENIAIALISYWDMLWPLEVSNRITLLNWLNRQIADNMRLQVQSHQDIKALYCLDNALTLIVEEIKKHSDLAINLNNLLVSVNEQIDKRVTSQYDKNIERGDPIVITSPLKPSLKPTQKTEIKADTRKQKGIYGEQISDEFMENRQFRSVLSSERQMRLLEGKPTGRGIDGVYANPKPPPPYIITETKFRTNAGEYIDSDGSLSKTNKVEDLLGSSKDGKQMSDNWIANRLDSAVSNKRLADDILEDHDKWLMIVDNNGKVVEIYQIVSTGRDVKVVGKINIEDYK